MPTTSKSPITIQDQDTLLKQQPDYQTARKYWNKLKERLTKEGSQSVTNCHRLKMPAADGKKYLTDVATAETFLRDHMSEAELIFTALAELSTRQIAESVEATGLERAIHFASPMNRERTAAYATQFSHPIFPPHCPSRETRQPQRERPTHEGSQLVTNYHQLKMPRGIASSGPRTKWRRMRFGFSRSTK